MYNADLPLTSTNLVKVFQQNSLEIFYGVPYALKLLSESEIGLRLLCQLRVVMYGGSACPDSLGNKLVDNGVNLVGHYGAYVFSDENLTVLIITTNREIVPKLVS